MAIVIYVTRQVVIIFSAIRNFFRAYGEWGKFNELPRKERKIVFYSEDKSSWVYLGPVVEALALELDRPLCYLTSAVDDPILQRKDKNISAFYIGDGMICTWAFMSLEADLCVMTMPDLETYHLKRSKEANVHYVHIFHSIVSSHATYRQAAFDHFDSVLCVGPHHFTEIRATEKAYGLPEKRLFEHGYGRLDELMKGCADIGKKSELSEPLNVLVAPSWGDNAILEAIGESLVSELLTAGFQVTVRPHPMTIKRTPQVCDELGKKFSANSRFELERDIRGFNSLAEADVLISDWSGIALEYAFVWERPVLFIDLPQKINNPEYDKIGIEPLESSIREKLGPVVSPDDLKNIKAAVTDVANRQKGDFGQVVKKLRKETVFNIGQSGLAGAKIIAELADELS